MECEVKLEMSMMRCENAELGELLGLRPVPHMCCMGVRIGFAPFHDRRSLKAYQVGVTATVTDTQVLYS